jgi:hypothetical protein
MQLPGLYSYEYWFLRAKLKVQKSILVKALGATCGCIALKDWFGLY